MFSILEMLEFGIYLDEVKSEVYKTFLQYRSGAKVDVDFKLDTSYHPQQALSLDICDFLMSHPSNWISVLILVPNT